MGVRRTVRKVVRMTAMSETATMGRQKRVKMGSKSRAESTKVKNMSRKIRGGGKQRKERKKCKENEAENERSDSHKVISIHIGCTGQYCPVHQKSATIDSKNSYARVELFWHAWRYSAACVPPF
jgi:hypothetical protein